MSIASTLRVGFPSYINTLPLLHYLPQLEGVEIVLDTPARLNQLLARAEIVCGLCSSIFYARHASELLLLPDISISSVGRVKSVCLFHKQPLERLSGAKIGITPESETSFVLLRLILELIKGQSPVYLRLSKPLSRALSEDKGRDKELLATLSGYLAIGNEALELLKAQPFPQVTDLAELWLEETSFPFVFALLPVRADLALSLRKPLKDLAQSLYLSRAKALANLELIANYQAKELDEDFIVDYLHHLEFDFSGLKQRAFLHFCRLAKVMGLIPEVPRFNFVEL